MEKKESFKIKIKKISFSKFKKDNSPLNVKKTIKNYMNLNSVNSLKEIKTKNELYNKDAFSARILNKIKRSKSRQSIFGNSQYLFYGKDENNIKLNSTLKSTIEMESKFNIRNREGLRREDKSYSLLNFLSKDSTRVLQEEILKKYSKLNKIKRNQNGKKSSCFQEKNKNLISNNKPLNSRKINASNHTFIISRPMNFNNNKIKTRLSFIIPNVPSSSQNKSMSTSFSKIFEFKNEKDLNFEKVAKHNVKIVKKILKKRMKQNSKILSDSLFHLGEDTLLYEHINKIMSNRNVGQKIYINKSNLSRLIKVNRTIKHGFYEDDINDIKSLKDYSKNMNNIYKHLQCRIIPKSVKTNHFSRSAIFRYNQMNGNYFGIPV